MKTIFSRAFLSGLWDILWTTEVKRYYAERGDLLQLGATEPSTNTFLLCGIHFRWDGHGFKYLIGKHKGRIIYKDQIMCMGVFFDISREVVIGAGVDVSKFSRAVRLYYLLKEDAIK